MDFLGSASVTPASSQALSGHVEQSTQGFLVSMPLLIMAVAVFMIEKKRRHANDNADGLLVSPGRSMPSPCSTLSSLLPECVGILLVVACACMELHKGDDHSTLRVDDEVSREIKDEWPLLKTADSLLGIQAILRLLLLVSAILRRGDFHKSPFAGMPVVLFFFAALCRVTLITISPADVYHLDGPMGKQNFVIEAAALPLLFALSVTSMRMSLRTFFLLVLGVSVSAAVAFLNHFELAGDAFHLDVIFSFVQLLEFFAGVAFAFQSLAIGGFLGSEEDAESSGGVFTNFVHTILPLQQALAMYYFLCAFAPPFTVEPSLVGKGHPFEVMQLAGLAQVGMYIFAGVWHFSVLADKRVEFQGMAR